MRVGQIGRIVGDPSYKGHVMKCHNVYVLLDDPSRTWSYGDTWSGPNFDVELLLPGEVLRLIAGV